MEFTKNNVTAYKDDKLPGPPEVTDGPNWAVGLGAITQADAETLLITVQTLYPHETLPLAVYRRVVLRFARLAESQPRAAGIFAGFCTNLDTAWPIAFGHLAETYRVAVLKSLENTEAFIFVQRLSVKYLYDDIEVWANFGYQGASVHLGGYAKRGFNDLDWLPPLPNDL